MLDPYCIAFFFTKSLHSLQQAFTSRRYTLLAIRHKRHLVLATFRRDGADDDFLFSKETLSDYITVGVHTICCHVTEYLRGLV